MITAPQEEFSKPLAVHRACSACRRVWGNSAPPPQVILSLRCLLVKKVPIELKSGNSQKVKHYREWGRGWDSLNHLFSPFHFKVPWKGRATPVLGNKFYEVSHAGDPACDGTILG